MATLESVGELFGLLSLVGETEMIDLIGPMQLHRGDGATYRLTVFGDDDARADLTGATIELEVKAALGGADPAPIIKAVGTGITIAVPQTGGTKGQADIVIDSADSDIAPALYWLDVVVTLAGGQRKHVLAPREFTILPVVNAP